MMNPRRSLARIAIPLRHCGNRKWPCSLRAGAIFLTVVFLLLIGIADCAAAVPVDPRLLSLVPPGSEIVAGVIASHGHRSDIVLMSKVNTIDLADFYAITGSDPNRVIAQLVLAAAPGRAGDPPEHSLLASGSFDIARIFKFAGISPSTRKYHGVTLFAVSPFDRERSYFNLDRLFAVIDSHLVIFGSPASVEQEIQRYTARSQPDSSLVQRLQRLRRNTDTWCLLAGHAHNGLVQKIFAGFNPELANVLEKSGALEYGIHHASSKVEFEYETSDSPVFDSENGPEPGTLFMTVSNGGASTFVARERGSGENQTAHGIVKVATARYEAWMWEVTATLGSPTNRK
jgi:hypothetical protein